MKASYSLLVDIRKSRPLREKVTVNEYKVTLDGNYLFQDDNVLILQSKKAH